MSTTPKTARGNTLIEVMVALVLLTTGMLGMAYMQNMSGRVQLDSWNRGQITFTVNGLIDSMRALQVSPDDGTTGHQAYTTPPLATDSCMPGDTSAANLVHCFHRQVAETLPLGTSDIRLADLNGDGDDDGYQVTVYWSERGISWNTEDTLDQTKCQSAGDNRAWSTGLAWHFNNTPGDPFCAVSRSWSVEVFNRAAL